MIFLNYYLDYYRLLFLLDHWLLGNLYKLVQRINNPLLSRLQDKQLSRRSLYPAFFNYFLNYYFFLPLIKVIHHLLNLIINHHYHLLEFIMNYPYHPFILNLNLNYQLYYILHQIMLLYYFIFQLFFIFMNAQIIYLWDHL